SGPPSGPPPSSAPPPEGGAPVVGAPEVAGTRPETPLRAPARRHQLTSVQQSTVAKDWNSVFEPGVDVAGDVRAINEGRAERRGDRWIVNGRTYGSHDGTLYPIEGEGIHRLDRGAFKALGVYNQFGLTPRAEEILGRMGIGDAQRDAAQRAWRAGHPEG
ncbi:hypothetical protein L6R52_20220, partial [Myxococcota bacterium]|nr:hypothetical protein [Myxococcota bacterium]